MDSMPTGKHLRLTRIIFAAIVLSSLAAGALTFAGNDGPRASAQSFEACISQRTQLCITKQTIGGDSEFRFDFTRDADNDLPEICLEPNTADAESVLLSNGESVATVFKCSMRVTEAPRADWQLVDIECDFDSDAYDITRISNGILIQYNPSTFDFDQASRLIECTFVNQIVRQPLNLGGLFSGQPTPLPTAPAAVAPAPAATSPAITPPRTGDAGLQ